MLTPVRPRPRHDRAFAPTDAIESAAPSRRGRAALLPDRSRGAVKKGSGDAGRYSRSFGLSASIASPPCGEWKAYRVTAAIARKLKLKLTETRSISVAQQDGSPGRCARGEYHQWRRLANRRPRRL